MPQSALGQLNWVRCWDAGKRGISSRQSLMNIWETLRDWCQWTVGLASLTAGPYEIQSLENYEWKQGWSTPTCTTTGIDVGGKRKKRYILPPKLALSIKCHKLWTEPRRGPMKSSNLQSDKINLYFNWQRLSTLVALHFQTPTVKLTSIWVPQNHPWTIGPSVLRQVSQRLSLADKHPYHSVALRWSGSHVLCLSFPIFLHCRNQKFV